jgi:hypothetical protein
MGAGLGAGVVALIVANFGVSEVTSAGGDLLPWLVAIMLVIVAQFALAGGLFAFAMQQVATPKLQPAPRRASPLATRRQMAR